MSKKTILFTTPILHHPPIGGPTLRIENSIKALAQISDLYIYSRSGVKEIGGKSAIKFYEGYCKKFYFLPPLSLKNRVVRLIKKMVNKISSSFLKTLIFTLQQYQEDDYSKLLQIANDIHADIIWLGYGNISYPLLKYIKENSNYKVVLDTDSVWSRYVLRGLPYAKSDDHYQQIYQNGQSKIEEETWGTKLADITTAVSEVDAEYYRVLANDKNQICLFSNVIDINTYKMIPPLPKNFCSPSIFLAGSFSPDSPMDDAARWVINLVLPLIRQQIPNIHFYIIGNGSDTTLSDIQDSQITITGKLESVLPYLCHVNVALVPLRFESGTRFKILEAGACKIPVVSTTLGAEGIPVKDGVDILIADQPQDFANAIIKLIHNEELAKTISLNLYGLIKKEYSIGTLINQAEKIIDNL